MVIAPIPEPDPAVECPFGAWATPVTSEVVVAAAVRLGEVRVDGTDVVWAEGRPAEGGRTQLVRRRADGGTDELLPEGRNARTAVHEYGGAAWWVRDGVVWFTDWADQRLYRLEPGARARRAHPRAGPTARRPLRRRRARPRRHPDRLRPRAAPRRPRHRRRQRDRDPRRAHAPSEPQVLVTGPDFVAAPRLSPDGATLAWLQWDHPAMPWDAAELVIRDLATGEETVVAGGPGESVTEPQWRPDGSLWFLSDRTDWWNLYRWQPGRDIETVVRTRGRHRRARLGVRNVPLRRARRRAGGRGALARRVRRPGGARPRRHPHSTSTCPSPPSARSSPPARTRSSWWRAAPPRSPGCTASTCPAQSCPAEQNCPAQIRRGTAPRVETLRAPRDLGLAADEISVPEAVRFPSVDGAGEPRTGRALFYPPANPRSSAARQGSGRRCSS